MMITKELLEKCITKDVSAWNEFAHLSGNLVLKSVRYKLNKMGLKLPKSDIQDIVQDIFLSIWENNKLSKINDVKCLKGWLAIVSINMTLNYCRKNIFSRKYKTVSLDKQIFDEGSSVRYGDIIPSVKNDTAKTLQNKEFRKTLEKELSKFRPEQRLILKLNLYDGKTHKDIGKIMNIPEGTVAATISRVRKKIRKNLHGFL